MSQRIRICVAGASGRMGQMLVEAVGRSDDMVLSGALDIAGSTALGLDAGAFAGLNTGVRITDDIDAAPGLVLGRAHDALFLRAHAAQLAGDLLGRGGVDAEDEIADRREDEEPFGLEFEVGVFVGLGGVLDIASEMGIERTRLDFGQTLGRWGVPSGPYLVLPIFGPSSFRDAAGFSVEARGDLIQGVDSVSTRNALTVLRAVETRANLLRATSMLEGAALDKYSFTRDVYLRRRQSQIEDLIDLGIGVRNGTEDTENSK